MSNTSPFNWGLHTGRSAGSELCRVSRIFNLESPAGATEGCLGTLPRAGRAAATLATPASSDARSSPG